jgi:hypothetical protein
MTPPPAVIGSRQMAPMVSGPSRRIDFLVGVGRSLAIAGVALFAAVFEGVRHGDESGEQRAVLGSAFVPAAG